MSKLFTLFGAFFGWWFGELAGLVPAALKTRLRPTRRLLVVDWSRAAVSLLRFQGQGGEVVGRIERARRDDSVMATDIKSYIGTPDPARDELVLRLPADQALSKRLSLPLAAEPDLRHALGFQIERHTPFTADDVYYDYAVTERDAKEQRLDIDLVVVPKPVVDESLADLERWGFHADRVDVAAPDAEMPPTKNLLLERAANGGRKGRARLNGALALIAAGLVAGAIYLPLEAKRETVAALDDRLKAARERADKVTQLTETVEALRRDDVFLTSQKKAKPATVLILDDLTALLPDDTYLASFRVREREVRVNGFSNSASALIALIEGAEAFEQPRFRAPVTQDPRAGRERFSLSFELRQADSTETGQ